VLVVKVDSLYAEPPQASLAGFAYIIGPSVHAACRRIVRIANDAELGRDDDLIAPVLDGLADQILVGEWAVGVGSIEKIDAELDRAMNSRNRLAIIARTIEIRHAHASEPNGRDFESLPSEFALLHFVSPLLG